MKKISPELVKTLQEFSRSYIQKREKAFSGLDFRALREELARIKDRAIERSDELLDVFMARAAARGSHVHFAGGSRQANEIIYRVLKDRGVKVLVKGKSMVSEETGLNDYLSRRGIEARETDLGEWIIQLAGEAPTHMVMPAIHLNRRQVAEVFRERLGEEVPEDISRLVKVARRQVRKKILEAGAGLSGANALLAEEGAILLVTNEGNGRLVTSVPPVHIVLTSREKVLPSLPEALKLLRILTRNATGQEISSYVSVIAGPPREEQHIVIVDNNRSRLKQDYEFREVLRCIKCSACLNVCPVYQLVGGQEFSHVYMGGIGSLLTAWVHGLKKSKDLVSFCLSCHRCDEICSAEIPIAELVRKLRAKIVREEGGKLWKKAAFGLVLGKPPVERNIFALGRAARPLISREGKLRIPLAAGVLKRLEKFPAPAEKSFSSILKEEKQKEKESGGEKEKGGKKVALFPGCLIENFFPETGLAAYRILRRSGFEVEAPFDGCCGFPAASSGFVDEARKEFKRVADKLLAGGYYRIVTFCPTCTSMLRELGPGLLAEIMLDEEKARVFKERIRTFVSFAAEEGLQAKRLEEIGEESGGGEKKGQAGAGEESRAEEGAGAGESTEQASETEVRKVIKHEKEFKGEPETESGLKTEGEDSITRRTRIAYHDSCHHKFVLKEERLSRELLEKAGYELAEMENSDICCGFAGVFSVEKAEISEELLRQKLEAIEKSGAEVVAVDCPGCLLQIKGGLLAAGKKIRARHTAELITGE